MARLYIKDLNDEIIIEDKPLHYLLNVLKKNVNDIINVFDGKNGEFEYEIAEISKKRIVAKKINKIKKFTPCLDVWLLFAPLKKDATDFVIQKATELGVKKIIPIITKRVNNHNFNQKRAMLQAIEASEQCERLDIPEIEEPQKIDDVLKNWEASITLMPLLEREDAINIKDALFDIKTNKVAILVGPEGGFDEAEKQRLKEFLPVSMGQRILRAETACVAALACYQAIKGDFRPFND